MKIDFDNPKHENLINNYDLLSKKYGQKEADDILVAIATLDSADTLFDIPHTYHPHPLKFDFKGYFAIWVNKNKTHRVIFRPNQSEDPNFRIYNFKTINSIIIIEIFYNYHKK